jgi:hypothetical protein
MSDLINWPDWMRDDMEICMDKEGDIHFTSRSGDSISAGTLAMFVRLPDNFITQEYLELDWKESKIVKGEG